ncbi:MAG: hypothetical protein WCD70_15080 [Alphaproteobacteria bacterium]
MNDERMAELREMAKQSHPCSPDETLRLIAEIEILKLKVWQHENGLPKAV